ncbi:hypothetical protein E2562_019850 [Oryza meyeriana var. granulata]|uniref:Uncharacterized protein n=1 Tax=Oryza meyeriana var. granulata TaxID=110450 RepID=A0A6G1CS60_9ORYZ|nr:hypothetical protein E2562_019850 [Oryza meyeriana var. granulata]
MWAYEHFQIGRPVVGTSPYEYPAGIDPVNLPTMGTYWVKRRDTAYWLTCCWLVFDVHVEEYTIDWVMR